MKMFKLHSTNRYNFCFPAIEKRSTKWIVCFFYPVWSSEEFSHISVKNIAFAGSVGMKRQNCFSFLIGNFLLPMDIVLCDVHLFSFARLFTDHLFIFNCPTDCLLLLWPTKSTGNNCFVSMRQAYGKIGVNALLATNHGARSKCELTSIFHVSSHISVWK